MEKIENQSAVDGNWRAGKEREPLGSRKRERLKTEGKERRKKEKRTRTRQIGVKNKEKTTKQEHENNMNETEIGEKLLQTEIIGWVKESRSLTPSQPSICLFLPLALQRT